MKKILNRIITLLLCATLLFSICACGETDDNESAPRYEVVAGEYLYKDGVSEYSILVRDDANYYENFAAMELSQNLAQATGGNVSIVTEKQLKNKNRVISLGHTKLWDEKVKVELSKEDIIDSGYYMTTVENNVYISCPDFTSSSGVLYGVYDFLHDIVDYEFFAVNETYLRKTNEIPLVRYSGLIVNPSFEMRQLRNADLRDDSITVMRYRMVYPSPTFGMATWGHGQLSQYVRPNDLCTCGKPGCDKNKTHLENHPDWFSNIGTDKEQLCWTGGEWLERETANKFGEYFKQYPDAEYFMFGQEDNVSSCDCDRCEKAKLEYAMNPAGLQVAFMNNVIKLANEDLAKKEPGRKVKYVIYAYYGCRNAPVKVDANGNTVAYSEKVKPCKDLYIFYTPIETNFAFQINSNYNADIRRDMENWSAIADGQIIMYLYDINFRNYFINFNNFGTVKGMYEECKELGVACMTSQAADSYTCCFQEMRSYVESSLMWDLSQSYDDLVRKFMKHYYKDAADYIYEYYNILRDRYAYYQNVVDPNSGGIYGLLDSSDLWSQPIVEKMDVLFDKALASIKKYKEEDPEFYLMMENRIMKERLTPLYIKITVLASYYDSYEIAQFKETIKHYVNVFKLAESKEGSCLEDVLN